MGRSDDRQLAYWVATRGFLPDADPRDPWTAVGGGGTLTSKGVRFVTAAARKGYTRAVTRAVVDERVDVQADFQLTTNNPTWASGASGHILWIDDGQRALGLSIGTTVRLVNPETGSIVYTPPQNDQPGGATQTRGYLFVKDGTSAWEVWVEGKLVARLPYAAAPLGTETVGTVGFGWQDATALSSSSGLWNRVEVGHNLGICPHWKVDRMRSAMPGPLQTRWTDRHEAFLRALLLLQHSTQDQMERLARRFTAMVLPTQRYTFSGEKLPTDEGQGWTLGGDSGSVSVVRQRVRIEPSANPTYAQRLFDTPANTTDPVYYAAARFTARELDSTNNRGRLGPYLQIRDGAQRVGVFLVREPSNPEGVGWLLSDQEPGGELETHGESLYRIDPYTESFVELFVITGDRVILFVDGEIAEEQRYDYFNNPTSARGVRIGREGSASISCSVDIEDAVAALLYGDNAYRVLFARRVAERLLFAAGCERNDRLDAWLRRRHGVFSARGTDRSIYEIRRLACDDEAQLVVTRRPGMWYLGITFPMVTPTFISANGLIPEVVAEYVADAPNFTPAQLQKLIERYILPRSILEARFSARLVAILDDATATVGSTSEFSVEDTTGFAVGDEVTLREETSGTLLSLAYDADAGMTDLAANTVRDFAGTVENGTLSGNDATIGNGPAPERDAVLIPDNAGAGQTEGIRSPSITADITGGFTCAGWFRNAIVHDGTQWTAFHTDTAVGTKGFTFVWNAAGQLRAEVMGSLGGKVLTAAFAPAANTWTWLAIRWNSSTNVLTIWKDGVQLAASGTTALTVDNPTGIVAFGCEISGSSNKWKGRQRDYSLYERTLTDAEMLELYQDSSGRIPLRSDTDLRLLYLPSGFPAVHATHAASPPPVAADYMEVNSFLGQAWADWALVSKGTGNVDLGGLATFAGKSNEKAANITAGAVVRVTAASASEDTWVEVFGLDGGLPVSERLHIVGTTPVVGTVTWDEVHGVTSSSLTLGNIVVADDGTATTLYTISTGTRARGVYLFDPPLLCLPSQVAALPDGATTDDLLFFGVEEGAAQTAEALTLAGATTVITTTSWASLRVMAAGYVSNTVNVLLSAGLVNRNGTITIVSNNAGDVQIARAFVLDVLGQPHVLTTTLTGTTPATFPSAGTPLWHILGIELQTAAVGTVTVTLTHTPTITICQLSAGQSRKGVDRRAIDNTGELEFELGEANATPLTTARYVLVYGDSEEDGSEVVDAVLLGSDERAGGTQSFQRVRAVITGHLPATNWVRVEGRAFRADSFQGAAQALEAKTAWTVLAGAGSPAFDGVLDPVLNEDATLQQVDLAGTWSESEDTEILTLDPETGDISTPLLDGSFGVGARMRLKESA